MQHRQINRLLLLGKVLRKYNKNKAYKITPKRLFIIQTVNLLQPATLGCIRLKLDELGRTIHWLGLLTELTEMQNNNLVIRTGSKYSTTFEAMMVLNTIETMLRKERFDK